MIVRVIHRGRAIPNVGFPSDSHCGKKREKAKQSENDRSGEIRKKRKTANNIFSDEKRMR